MKKKFAPKPLHYVNIDPCDSDFMEYWENLPINRKIEEYYFDFRGFMEWTTYISRSWYNTDEIEMTLEDFEGGIDVIMDKLSELSYFQRRLIPHLEKIRETGKWI